MARFLDSYSLRARLAPSLIAAAPILTLLAIFIRLNNVDLTHLFGTITIMMMILILSDFARRAGRRVEEKIYSKIGGKPTVTMLRHRDNQLDSKIKIKVLRLCGKILKENPPSEEYEQRSPKEADNFYERCGTVLREHFRQKDASDILFYENITYGFRRNLYGLKRVALTINILAVLFFIAYTFAQGDFPMISYIELESKFSMFLLAIVCLVHAIYFICFVTESSVIDGAKLYARQLFNCALVLDEDGLFKSPANSR
jgi:hypothetical protein